MSPCPTVSVCIATRGRPDLVDRLLGQLRSQAVGRPVEVLVGVDDDVTTSTLVRRRHGWVVVIDVAGMHPGAVRNRLVRRSQGDLLVFLDDDVAVPDDFLRSVTDLAERWPGVAVLGGANLTPPGATPLARAQGIALASPLFAGAASRRYRRSDGGAVDERALALCNLVVRRGDWVPFPDDVRCAEENAVLGRLRATGAVARVDRRLAVHHERRGDLGAFARQVFTYGTGRGQLLRRGAGPPRWLVATIAAALAYAVGFAALAVAGGVGWAVGTHAGVVVGGAVVGCVRQGAPRLVPVVAVCGVVLHAAYPLGLAVGAVRGPARRRRAPAGTVHPCPR